MLKILIAVDGFEQAERAIEAVDNMFLGTMARRALRQSPLPVLLVK